MRLDLAEHLQVGAAAFLSMAFVVMAIFRLTRRNHLLRSRIKIPLLVLFFLLTIYDIFFVLSRPIPTPFDRYYFAVLYFSFAVFFIRLATYVFFILFMSKRKKYRIPKLLEELTKVALYTIAAVSIIQHTLNIQLTTVLATSAIITVVLGLALQETLGNLFAGLALHLDPAYQVGDWIRTENDFGKVEEVTWRATKLRTTNNDYIIIPNGQIAKGRMTNLSFPRTPHATHVNVSMNYSVPPNKVGDVVRKCLSEVDNVTMDPPPEVRVHTYGEFSLEYLIKFWYKDAGLLEPMLASVRKRLWYHFHRSGLDIPFPIRHVYLHEREEQLSGKTQKLQRLSDSLQKVYLFSLLDEEERRLIAENLEELHYAKNELIIREGEAGDSFFIIDEGEVEVFINSPHKTRKVLTRLMDGDFFGEIALLTGERRTASVQATTDTRVYELKKDRFKKVLERKPDILDEIGSVLSRRKDQLVDLMSEASGSSGEPLSISPQDAKTRILRRIRNYFGL
jgi:small-conductance mechanosensitive channel/CRP-like cAMP-binding protein